MSIYIGYGASPTSRANQPTKPLSFTASNASTSRQVLEPQSEDIKRSRTKRDLLGISADLKLLEEGPQEYQSVMETSGLLARAPSHRHIWLSLVKLHLVVELNSLGSRGSSCLCHWVCVGYCICRGSDGRVAV